MTGPWTGTQANASRKRLAFALSLAAVLVWRFVQIRSLALPAWVDSVHHTLLVRLLLELRSIPDTWAPYLPDVPFYYHFGFHLTAALLARIAGWTGILLGRAVLVTGQLWQVALAAGVYAAAFRLWQDRDRALTALILVGFVSQMPAYYVSWGRYTLLAGLALLAWGMAAALAGRGILVAVLLAATAITHYYAFGLFLAFLGLVFLAGDRNLRLRVGIGTLAGLLVSTPWLIRVWYWTRVYARAPRAVQTTARPVAERHLWELLGPERNHMLVFIAAAGLILLTVRAVRGRFGNRASGWSLLGLSALHLALLRWQIGPFRPDHAAIALFLPVVLLAPDALWTLLPRRTTWGVVSVLTLWGVFQTRDVIRNDTVLARDADLRAIAWIDKTTPSAASFLIDVEPWMGIWRGADGGWWITPLTGRRTVLPPVAYGWGEPELSDLVRGNAARLYMANRLPDAQYCGEIDRLMTETGADYYYTRSRRTESCRSLSTAYRDAVGPAIYVRSPLPNGG